MSANPSHKLVGLSDQQAIREIKAAVKEAKGNRAAAARRLGLDRRTLYRYLERLKLTDWSPWGA